METSLNDEDRLARARGIKPDTLRDFLREKRQFVKFLVVGAFTWTVDFTTLNLLQHTILVPNEPNTSAKVFAASATAFFVGITVNFLLNRTWTFKANATGSVPGQVLRYAVVVGIAVSLRLVFILASYRLIGEVSTTLLESLSLIDPADPTLTNQIGTNIANILSIPMIMLWNFFGHKHFTYRDTTTDRR